MNAFEFAMKMELDGKEFYEKQAAKMTLPALQQIFHELASDEQKHYEVFRALQAGKKTDVEAAFKTTILATTKNVFQKMRGRGDEFAAFAADVRQAWQKALEIEDKSEKFYREQADKAVQTGQKKIWNKISDEEHKHWVAISNVIQFLARPSQWLDNAEWSNLEPY